MAYSTVDQVLSSFKIAGTALGVGSIDISTTDISSYFIYTSDGVIDGYIGRRYAVPVSPAPPILTKISCDLSIFSMFQSKGMKVPDWMTDRYSNAMSLLKDISNGTVVLVGSGVSEVESGDNDAYSTSRGYHPIFSPVLDPLSQTVDRDLVVAEKAERTTDGCDTDGF